MCLNYVSILFLYLNLLILFHISWQGFVTNNENALEELYSDDENHQRADACLNVVAKRIATVLASLRVQGVNPKLVC